MRAAPKSITHWIKLQVIKQAKLDLQDLEWLEDAVSAYAGDQIYLPSFRLPPAHSHPQLRKSICVWASTQFKQRPNHRASLAF